MGAQSMSGPCTGLSVLDLSNSLAGAVTTMLLADNGADVTLAEPQSGHPLRSQPGFLVWSRGKQSLSVGHNAEDVALLRRLALQADVVVESAISGDRQYLGFSSSGLLAENPRLILCSMPAFGPTDPNADQPPDDGLVAARAGIMGAQPGYRPGPVFVRPPLSSYGAALLAVQAIGAALFARARSDLGRAFTIPLLHGALAMQASHLLEVEHGDPVAAPGRAPLGGRPLYRLYQCQDGRWLHFGVLTPRFWPGVALALGHPEWISDPRYQTMPNLATTTERDAFAALVAAEMDKRPYAEWERLLEEQDVPFAPALTVDEFMRDPQVAAAEMLVQLQDPRVGSMRQIGLPIRFHRTPGGIRGSAPALGEANARLRRIATEPVEMSPRAASPDLHLDAAPLSGVRILDFSSFIAGPLGPVFLADLGADVIKIESPEGDGLRLNKGFLGWNRGKRGLALDLKRAEARDVLSRLLEGADVVLENMRPGVAERLGIGYEEMRRRNPRLIYCSVTAYGPQGPYRDRPGFDPLMQARSGIERAQGGLENPPTFLLVPLTDNACAMLNAAGIALALQERERSGLGQKLETSLLRAACLLQSDSMIDYDSKPPRPANDPSQFGPNALNRLYRCADGWIFVAAQEAEPRANLAALAGATWQERQSLPDADANRTEELRLAERLSNYFAAEGVEACLDRLHALGIAAVHVVENYAEHFPEDPRLLTEGLVITYAHPRYGQVRQPALLARLSDPPPQAVRPAPLIGQHTREILAELGYDHETITDFIDRGIAVAAPDV
jgi:crotonobetainyl-CoA:carnitine CoA-transferase CaiB-like acyl-CoA transferase